MSAPMAVMLTPDAFCQSFAARDALAQQLAGLGSKDVVVVDDPQSADVVLLHVAPKRMPLYLASLPQPMSSIRVACPSHAAEIHQLMAAKEKSFDAIFASSLTHWHLAQALCKPVFWVQPGCAAPTAPHLASGVLWRARLGLSASSCVVLVIEDGACATAPRQALACAQRAFAYIRLRDASARLVLWQRQAGALRWRAEPDHVVRLQGQVPPHEVHALFAASDVFVRTHAGCNTDVVQAMAAGVLCVAAEDHRQSGLLTAHNSLQLEASQIVAGVMHVHRDTLECALIHAMGHVKRGTHVTLTRQAQRDAQCLAGSMPAQMLRHALRRVLHPSDANARASETSYA